MPRILTLLFALSLSASATTETDVIVYGGSPRVENFEV
jgi:hypothetical protein